MCTAPHPDSLSSRCPTHGPRRTHLLESGPDDGYPVLDGGDGVGVADGQDGVSHAGGLVEGGALLLQSLHELLWQKQRHAGWNQNPGGSHWTLRAKPASKNLNWFIHSWKSFANEELREGRNRNRKKHLLTHSQNLSAGYYLVLLQIHYIKKKNLLNLNIL